MNGEVKSDQGNREGGEGWNCHGKDDEKEGSVCGSTGGTELVKVKTA